MKKYFSGLIVLLLLTLLGCSNGELSGDEPPAVFLTVNDVKHETTLGSYCWTKGCADTAGPVELLEGKDPVTVKPGENLSLGMDFEPKPTEYYLSYFRKETETDVAFKNNVFTAPKEKGLYHYAWSVRWQGEKAGDYSQGDAFYAFALEVK